MKHYLLSGSFAYDTILLHEGHLEAAILPESISRLNVCFGIDHVENEFGGTAGNIGYNASLLKQQPLLVGSLGEKDSSEYIEKLDKSGLDSSTLTLVEKQYCAHAWILTDKNNNQITSFSSGAMKYRPTLPSETPEIWHLAPENPLTMAKLIVEGKKQNKQIFFDPGQMLPTFLEGITNSVLPLDDILKSINAIFVNEYEAELLSSYFKKPLEQLVQENDLFIIRTLGKDGVDIITKNNIEHVGVAKTTNIVDPTGCGDAFRAGFLYGYTQNAPLTYCAQVGATMGSFAIEHSGGQNHTVTFEEINMRLNDSFGVTLLSEHKAKNPLKY